MKKTRSYYHILRDFHKVVFDQTDGNIWTLMQSKPYLSKTFNETYKAQDGYCRNFIMTPC